MNYDFIIIGQGLAGSILALNLINNDKKVLVIDNKHKSSSSIVALGLINPLAGMRFNLSPNVTHWLSSAEKIYTEFGLLKNNTYLRNLDMFRMFRSLEQKKFLARQEKELLQKSYIQNNYIDKNIYRNFKCPFGGFLQKKTAIVDIFKFLQDIKSWLQTKDSYIEENLYFENIKISLDNIAIGKITTKNLIFCEGHKLSDNPWFNKLPLQPDKGEYFELRSSQDLCDKIINGSSILIPYRDGKYRFGSTHQHKKIINLPSLEGQKKLLTMQNNFFLEKKKSEVIAHYSGIRPSTSDRNPFIGSHPKEKKLHIFNGFGSRGSLTIPWYAEKLCDYFIKNKSIPKDANIDRFKGLF